MPRQPRRPDLHTLTGAYVLDALSEPERADFERHLAECEACAAEVVELRTVAARLAVAAEPPPAGLRQRLMTAVHHTRQLPPLPAADNQPTRATHRDRGPWTLIAVAASVTAALLSGVHAINLDSDLDRAINERQAAQGRLDDVSRVLGAADVTFDSGQGATVAVSRRFGVVLLARNLPVLPEDRVYQAWLIGPTGPRSIGLLTDPGPVLVDHVAGTSQLGITVEPLGGSPQPTTSAVALLTLRS